MANYNGNLMGMGSKSNIQAIKSRRQGTKGHWKVAFVEPFTHVTERDLELRQEYAKDLIGRYVGVPKQALTFRKKSAKQTIVSLDEVFYVKLGVDTIGKVSIRIQRSFSYNNMDIIFQNKLWSDPKITNKVLIRSYKKKTKGFRMEQKRKGTKIDSRKR